MTSIVSDDIILSVSVARVKIFSIKLLHELINMSKVNNRTILIAGPTGSGKSNLAIKIAQKCKGIIINADSMQIYKQLSIVTARPSIEDEAHTPHFLYGTVDVNKRYSVGDWLESAKDIITFSEKLDLVTVIVGGTGLYFNSLFGSLSNIPGISDEIREKWLGIKNDMDSSYLYQQLLQLDPIAASSLNPNDSNRIIRALEVFEETGISIQEWRRNSGDKVISSHNSVRVFLNPKKDFLDLKIKNRTNRMVKKDCIQEIEELIKNNISNEFPIMKAIGVSQLAALIDGKFNKQEAIDSINLLTKRYAKRQMTWARKKMVDWEWIDPVDLRVEDILLRLAQ